MEGEEGGDREMREVGIGWTAGLREMRECVTVLRRRYYDGQVV